MENQMNNTGWLFERLGEGIFAWLISKSLDGGLVWLKKKEENENDFFSEVVENTINSFNELKLKEKYFLDLLNDPNVKDEIIQFENAQKSIQIDIVVNSFRDIVKKEDESLVKESQKIIFEFLEQIRLIIFRDPFYTSKFNYSLLEILRKNQTKFSTEILEKFSEQDQKIKEGFNVLNGNDAKTHQMLSQLLQRADNLPKSQNEQLNSKIDFANGLMKEGKNSTARDIYLQILNKVDKEEKELIWRLNANIGKTYLNDFDDENAVQHFYKAYNIYPHEEKGLIQLALAYLVEENFDDGIKVADEILNINPNSIDAITLKSNFLFSVDRLSEAISVLEKEDVENFEVCYALGLAYGKNKDFAKSVQILKKAIKIKRSPLALDLLAVNIMEPTIYKLQDLRPLKIDSESELFANLNEALGFLNESIAIWEKQENKKQLAIAYLNRGTIYTLLKDKDNGLEDYKSAEKLGLDDAILNRNIGICYIERGDYKSASKYFKKAIDQGDKNSHEHLLNALILSDHYSKAKEIILSKVDGSLKDLSNENYYYYLVLSEIYGRELLFDKQKDILEKLKKDFPHDIRVVNQTVRYLRSRGEFDEAIEYLDEKLKVIEHSDILKIDRAELNFELRNYEEVIEDLKDLVSDDKYSYLEKLFLFSHVNAGRYNEALSFINKLESNNYVYDENLLSVRGSILLFYEKFSEARDIYKRLATDSNKAEHYIKWGLCEFRLGESSQADKIFSSAEKDFTKNSKEYIRISSAFAMIGKIEKALEMAYDALVAMPDDIDAANNYLGCFIHYEQLHPSSELSEDKVKLFNETINSFEQKFPGNKNWRKIQIDQSLESLKEILKEDENYLKKIGEMRQFYKLPLTITTKLVNRNIYTTWSSFIDNSHQKIYAYDYLPLAKEEGWIKSSNVIIVEPIAFFTLYYINQLDLLNKLFHRYYFPQRLLDILNIEKSNLALSSETGLITLYIHEGTLYRQEISPIDIEKHKFQLIEMINFVKGKTIGHEIGSEQEYKDEKIFDFIDVSSKQAILFSLKKNIPLLIDESTLLTHFNTNHSLKGFSTRSLLTYAMKSNLLSEENFNSCLIRLIRGYYYFISVNAKLLLQGIKSENFRVTSNTQFLLHYLNQKDIDEATVAKVLAGLFMFLYYENISQIKRDAWIDISLDSLPRNRINTTQLLKMIFDTISSQYESLIHYKNVINWIDNRMNTWAQSRAVPYFK